METSVCVCVLLKELHFICTQERSEYAKSNAQIPSDGTETHRSVRSINHHLCHSIRIRVCVCVCVWERGRERSSRHTTLRSDWAELKEEAVCLWDWDKVCRSRRSLFWAGRVWVMCIKHNALINRRLTGCLYCIIFPLFIPADCWCSSSDHYEYIKNNTPGLSCAVCCIMRSGTVYTDWTVLSIRRLSTKNKTDLISI